MNTFRFVGLFLFLFFAGKNSIAQALKTYKDAANHFEISIPANWLVSQSNPRLKFIAIRSQTENYTSVPENINLNFIDAPNASLDSSYAMSIESNSSLDGFLSVTKKGAAPNGQYKWYVNTHKDPKSNLVMQSIVFVYYYKQKAVLLTCTALQDNFEKYNPVFLKMANSLKLQ